MPAAALEGNRGAMRGDSTFDDDCWGLAPGVTVSTSALVIPVPTAPDAAWKPAMHRLLPARATGEHRLQQCCATRASRHLSGNRRRSWWKPGTFCGSDTCQRHVPMVEPSREQVHASLEECPARGDHKHWYSAWPQPEVPCAGAASPNGTRLWEGMPRQNSRLGVECSDQLWMGWNSETLVQGAWMACVGMRAVLGATPSTRTSNMRQSITAFVQHAAGAIR